MSAILWQGTIAGWWSQTESDWHWYIQETANRAMLSALADLSYIASSADVESKAETAAELRERIVEADSFLIAERTKRDYAVRDGQAATISTITATLLFLGTLMLAIGKLMAAIGARQRLGSSTDGNGLEEAPGDSSRPIFRS